MTLRDRTIRQLAETLYDHGNTVKSLGDKGIATIAAHQFASGKTMTFDELHTALALVEGARKAALEASMGEGK